MFLASDVGVWRMGFSGSSGKLFHASLQRGALAACHRRPSPERRLPEKSPGFSRNARRATSVRWGRHWAVPWRKCVGLTAALTTSSCWCCSLWIKDPQQALGLSRSQDSILRPGNPVVANAWQPRVTSICLEVVVTALALLWPGLYFSGTEESYLDTSLPEAVTIQGLTSVNWAALSCLIFIGFLLNSKSTIYL